MKNFDQIQALWHQQSNPDSPPPAELIMAKAEQSHRRMIAIHRGTMLTLSVTVLVLAAYFWKYGSATNSTVLVSSLLMITPLLFRIGVEYGSYRLFKSTNVTTDLLTCLTRTTYFHRIRRGIQWIVTPLSLGCYVWGFILLLPYVKAGVSIGFYWYIIISGVLFLCILSIIIYRQIRGEMHLLKELKVNYISLLSD